MKITFKKKEKPQEDLSVALCRKLLKSIDITTKSFDDLKKKMNKEDFGSLLLLANQLNNDKNFQNLLKNLIAEQTIRTMEDAKNFYEVTCGQFSINGISLVLETIQNLASAYKEKTKPKEEFDPHEVV